MPLYLVDGFHPKHQPPPNGAEKVEERIIDDVDRGEKERETEIKR